MTDELVRVRRTLWAAADELRANSTLSPAEYRGLVLGLIFLAYAEHRFEQVRPALEAKATARRPVTADDYRARSVLFVPDVARLSGLVSLPEGENLGRAIDDAMKAVEAANPELRDVLPRGYQRLEKSTLSELLRLFAPLPRQLSGDAFGLIYEDFLSNFAASEGRLGGEFFTPYSIVRLIVEIIEPFHGKVFDPACGSGGMFVQCAKFVDRHNKSATRELSVYGVEQKEGTVPLAKMNLALHGDIRDLPSDVAWQEVSFQGPRGLTQGLQWTEFLDASARVESVRTRKLNAISRTHHNASSTLAGADLDDFTTTQKRAAEAALAAIGATPSQIVAFLTYLCERWNEWTGRGRQEVAAEYKRQIALAARMVMHAQNRDFPALAIEVGRVTGHFENTLDVIFLDWKKEAREKTELSLKHAIISKAPSADVNLTLTEVDVSNVLDWSERIDLWKIHLSIETILARQFSNSRVDHAALAKEVESMSTTFEHVVNVLLGEAGVLPVRTLMKKIQRFWNAVPEIHLILMNEHGLVSTGTKTRAAQVASIEALPAAGPNINVARTILKAVLYRNDGQHNAMTSWSEAELHEANRVFLTAIMFCRKNLLTNPPT